MKIPRLCIINLVFTFDLLVSKGVRNTRLTSTSIYIVDNQSFQLNCSSDIAPRGQAASFLINGLVRISVRYDSTLSQCFGTPTSGQSTPFVCDNTCSCSSDAKSYTWTYVGIMETVNVTFSCEMFFWEGNSETDTILITKAGRFIYFLRMILIYPVFWYIYI